MSHQEHSVHGKLDKILFLLEDKDIGICPRVKILETTLSGNADTPGLCEKVRGLQAENAKQSAFISTGITALMITGWSYIKSKFGL